MAKRRRVVVIGLGRFGTAVATTLYEIGHEVMAVDIDRELVQAISERVTHAVQADALNEQALADLGIKQFDTAIVGISADIERSILATVHLKRLGMRQIIAKAQTEVHAEILEKVGADRVVLPEREAGVRVAHSFSVPGALDYMPIGPDFGVAKVAPPAGMVGRTAAQFTAASPGVTLLLIERAEQAVLNPRADDPIGPGDLLIVAARDEAMQRLRVG